MAVTTWKPKPGDRVVLAGEHDPKRVGTVLDPGAVDETGVGMVAVSFPWSQRVVVVPVARLALVERPADPSAPVELLRVAEEVGRQLAKLDAAVHVVTDASVEPVGVEPHPFAGRGPACDAAGCGLAASNPVHRVLPPYRLRYLEDVGAGDALYVQEQDRWVRCTVLERRDGEGQAFLIVVDEDGDQRGLAGPLLMTLPVPL